MNDPIWIPCEGSGGPVNLPLANVGYCKMCGRVITTTVGFADVHDRQDVLAMIDRGDFG